MTDNEIIKALECLQKENSTPEDRHKCYFMWKKETCFNCHHTVAKEALDLINRQKAEIEKFKNRQKPTGASGYKIENGKVVFFANILGGCRVEKENLEEVVKTLNELLQECYNKDEIAFHLKCATEDLKTANAKIERLKKGRAKARADAIKEFADRLKDKICFFNCDLVNVDEDIDNLVKEMVGEE